MSHSGLEEYALLANPRRIIAIHGENPSEFANNMRNRGYNAGALTEGETCLI